jgi:Cu-Zn family superoxide dismutase
MVAVLALGLSLTACKKPAEEAMVPPEESATAAPTPPLETTPEVVTHEIAAAQLTGPGGATGMVTFTQEPGGVHVVARVEHVPAGSHGIHLHAGGSCDAPDFKAAGDHFNPTNAAHGAPDAAAHHAGDFGNIEVAADGTGQLDLTSSMLALGDGSANDVLGKAVIVHGGKDDLTAQPSGNSGARVACGVVQRAQGQAVAGMATPVPSPAYQ